MSKLLRGILLLLLLLCLRPAWAEPAVAFYYGANPPLDDLQAFDDVVVEPAHVPDPRPYQNAHTRLFAYVSIGEAGSWQPWFKDIPAAWLKAGNAAWGSRVIDQTAPGWRDFVLQRLIEPLWQQGYRGFFLDTLDSYQLIAKTPEEQARQVNALVELIRAIKARYPAAQLFLNRGFELLPQVHELVWGVAAESLYRGWDAGSKRFVSVSPADRQWLAEQLGRVRDTYHLPVVAIDYVAAENRELMRQTARQIEGDGFIPWVSTPELDTLGVGLREVQPRKVLLLYDSQEAGLSDSSAHLYGALPIEYWGYVPQYWDIRQGLPTFSLSGRYAGVVAWLPDGVPARSGYESWMLKQQAARIPLVFIGTFGVNGGNLLTRLGIRPVDMPPAAALPQLKVLDPALIGWEVQPRPQLDAPGYQLLPGKGRVLLQQVSGSQHTDLAAITPWGGYVLAPFVLQDDPFRKGQLQWVTQIFAFMHAALQVPDMPVPDTTTENGLRLAFAHIDGDGFPSLAELPGQRYAPEVLRTELLQRYPVPTAVSVIQAEIGPGELYPALSPRLEEAARAIFRLPNVEIASHTYSHPFDWAAAEASDKPGVSARAAGESAAAYNLPIKGYRFNLTKEIQGSVDYINQRLAPPGKRVKLFLWSGNALPSQDALQQVADLGLESMNGGETSVTQQNPSMTRVYPLGIQRGPLFQPYAPEINENVYTNDWHGPYYGYAHVIETYRMTNVPYRLKPVDIYYHTYSATKRASLQALDEVYGWALQQPLHWLWPSQWAHLAQQFGRTAVAREGDAWIIRNDGSLRTVRLPPAMGVPDMQASSGVAGYADDGGVRYVSLSGSGDARLVLKPVADTQAELVTANARLKYWRRDASGVLRFALQGEMPLNWSLRMPANCRLELAGTVLRPVRHDSKNISHFALTAHAADPLTLTCP